MHGTLQKQISVSTNIKVDHIVYGNWERTDLRIDFGIPWSRIL